MFGKKKKTTDVKLVYFIPRPRDNPPLEALRLGDIIEDPFDPEPAVNRFERVDIPEKLLLSPSEYPDLEFTTDNNKSLGAGLFASYLQAFGAELEFDRGSTLTETYKAEKLVTTRFKPDDKYIEDCFKDGEAKILLTGPNARSCLYMITSLKLAYGATKVVEVANKKKLHLMLGVDLTAAGAPGASVGPRGHYSKDIASKSSAGKRNFVFAYQLSELKWNKKEQRVTQKKHTGGEMYGDDDEADEADETDDDIVISAADIDIDDVDVGAFDGVVTQDVNEDGEEVVAMTRQS